MNHHSSWLYPAMDVNDGVP